MPPFSSGTGDSLPSPSKSTHRRRRTTASLSIQLILVTILLLPSTASATNPFYSFFFPSPVSLERRAPPIRNPHMNQAVEEQQPSSQLKISEATASATILPTSSILFSSEAVPSSQPNISSTPETQPTTTQPAPAPSVSIPAAVNGIANAPQTYVIDLQTFSKGLADVRAPGIVQSSDSHKPFQVDELIFVCLPPLIECVSANRAI